MAQKIQQYRDAIASCFSSDHSPRGMKQILSWIDTSFPGNDFTPSTFTAQVHKSCANVAAAYKSKAPKLLFYSKGNRTYRPATSEEISEGANSFGGSNVTDEIQIGEAFEAEGTFALEADLQRYLVRNLGILEKGLAVWDLSQPLEYGLDTRRVDILGKDVSGVPIVIELKLGKGLYQVIGQALHYRALVKKFLNVSRVRIMIVASEISDELQLAAAEVGDVTLWKYTLSMQVEKITEGE